jgi:membrane-associated phospholipid phosphatase
MLSTVLLGSYLVFILLPVDSPYYLSQHLGPPLSGHFFFDLVHQMSARGGARGGAFPSAHVSGAVVVSLVALRHQRRLAYLLLTFTGSVMIATVYGRFHYVLDVLAGAALGSPSSWRTDTSLATGSVRGRQRATPRSACRRRTECCRW